MEQQITSIQDSAQLIGMISPFKEIKSPCDEGAEHKKECPQYIGRPANCDNDKGESSQQSPQCSMALMDLIINVIAYKPKLIDDKVLKELIDFFRSKQLRASGLITHEVLNTIDSISKKRTSLMTWLKYEALLINLIKAKIYEPESMADELIRLTKIELEKSLSCKISSVVGACVKHCRDVSKDKGEELEEKYCEIIDWMSWFLTGVDEAEL